MNPKIEQALAMLTGAPASDFAELAILAADQAGMSAEEQSDLRRTLMPECEYCNEPAVENGHCEDCGEEIASAAKRQSREDAREAYGDYLRDEGRGMSRRDADYYASGENWRGE